MTGRFEEWAGNGLRALADSEGLTTYLQENLPKATTSQEKAKKTRKMSRPS